MCIVKPKSTIAFAVAGLTAAYFWWRRNPSPCPYGLRLWVQVPHPLITRGRLKTVLRPRTGERVLEIGPGTGYYTLDIAKWITGSGTVDIFDIQQEMLDHTMKRALRAGLTNVVPTLGDARALPYGDAEFDAVVLTTVLGEIPDHDVALREIARVLKPGGRLIVGEIFLGDPHWLGPRRLKRDVAAAGLRFVERGGSPLGYFARFDVNVEPVVPVSMHEIHNGSPQPN
ncbi:MAG: class I SAM-dependent methyltransferase [Thermoleophilia bacterium]|nr:class I SAM-dependent methyltransferase [Thermoleophilia bacterium]